MNRNSAGGLLLAAPFCAERDIALSSRGHCTAHSVFGHGAGFGMQGESALEGNHFHVLNARHDVAEMRAQVFLLWPQTRSAPHLRRFRNAEDRHSPGMRSARACSAEDMTMPQWPPCTSSPRQYPLCDGPGAT